MREKYVFRLSSEVKSNLDKVAPPKQHIRSNFIDKALTRFFQQEKKPLADRPHLRGRSKAYKQVCALVDTEHLEKAKKLYPDVSISVVIQAAIASELVEGQGRIEDLQIRNISPSDSPDDNQNPDDYSCAGGVTRNLATAFD